MSDRGVLGGSHVRAPMCVRGMLAVALACCGCCCCCWRERASLDCEPTGGSTKDVDAPVGSHDRLPAPRGLDCAACAGASAEKSARSVTTSTPASVSILLCCVVIWSGRWFYCVEAPHGSVMCAPDKRDTVRYVLGCCVRWVSELFGMLWPARRRINEIRRTTGAATPGQQQQLQPRQQRSEAARANTSSHIEGPKRKTWVLASAPPVRRWRRVACRVSSIRRFRLLLARYFARSVASSCGCFPCPRLRKVDRPARMGGCFVRSSMARQSRQYFWRKVGNKPRQQGDYSSAGANRTHHA